MQVCSKNPGIYQLTNVENGKIYIGSTVCLKHRISRHFVELEKQKHASPHLQNAFNKYGKAAFQVNVLKEFQRGSITRKKLLQEEQYFLDAKKPWDPKIGYNMCHVAGSPQQRKLSEETKKKISAALKGRKFSKETREKISRGNKGKRNPQEAIERMRKKKTGQKQSEESISKRAKTFAFIGPDGTVYKGENLRRFADKHGLHRYNLNKVLSGERKNHHGFKAYKEKQ